MPVTLQMDAQADVSQAVTAFHTLGGASVDAGTALDEAGAKGGGLFSKLGGGLSSVVSLVNPVGLLTAGVGFLGPKLLDAGRAAAAEQQEIDQLTNTLNNAVPAWDGNTEAIDEAVAAGQAKAFADTDLRKSLGQLATDTGSVEEAIRLQGLAMDLAASKGISLQAATNLVGKADDGSFASLSKLGIEIAKGTTREEALAAIHEKTAGAADLFAASSEGAGIRMQASLGDAMESIGTVVAPLMATVMGTLADVMVSLGPTIGTVANLISTILTPAFGVVEDVMAQVGPVVTTVVDAFMGFITQNDDLSGTLLPLGDLFSGISTALGGIGGVIQSVVTGFGSGGLGGAAAALTENLPGVLTSLQGIGLGIAGAAVDWALGMVKWVGDAIPGLVAGLASFGAAIFTWITTEGIPKAADFLMQMGQKFIDFIVPALPGMLQQLTEWGSGLINWILNEGIPQAVTMLTTLGEKFVAWIGPNIPPLLAALGEMGNKLIDWIAQEAPIIVGKLIEWGAALFDWIGKEVLPVLPGKLAEIGTALWGWLTTTVADLITKLAPMAQALLGWVQKDVLPFLGAKLGEFATAAWTWITTSLVPDAITNLKALGEAFIGWVGKDALPFIGAKLGEFAAAIWTWVTTEAVPAALTKLKEVGSSIIQGIMNGLSAGKDAVINFIKGIAEGAVQAIKDFFGIKSPSKVMADLFGLNGVTGGMVAGLQKGAGAVLGEAQRLQDGVVGILGGGLTSGAGLTATALVSAVAGGAASGGATTITIPIMLDNIVYGTKVITVTSQGIQERADMQSASYT